METGRGRDVAWRDEMARQLMTPTGEVLGSGVDTEAMIRALQGAPPPPSLLTSLGVSNEFNDKLAQTNIANFGPGMVRSAVGALTLPHDAMMGQVDPMSGQGIDRARDLAGMLTLGAGAMPAAEGELGMGIRAYHGSPHDFDAFDMSKIGTGEGAQVYGHGLYFAEHPGVAEEYRSRLAGQSDIQNLKLGSLNVGKHNGFDYSPKGNSTLENIRSSLAEDLLINESDLLGTPDIQKHVLDTLDAKIKDYHTEWPEAVPVAQQLRAQLAKPGAVSLKIGERPGKTYEVSINADPEHFLDWDKPLSEQPKAVQEAFKGMTGLDAADPQANSLLYKSGGSWLKSLEGTRTERGATDALRAAGIKGIRYKDAGSRGGEGGTHNYVVFDDKIIDILKKYGIAGLTAGGAAAAASQQDQPSLRDTIKSAMRGGT